MKDLKEYIVHECHKRFLSRKFFLSTQSDITPLVDLLIHMLDEWVRDVYPYYSLTDEITSIRLKLMSRLLREFEKHNEISVDQIADILTGIYERDISHQLRSRLKYKGIVLLKEYEDINVLLKSKLRYEALRLLARNWMSVRELSERLKCREEVVRRFLSDIKRLNIVMEQARISSQGRPVKVYKLATPIIVIDLKISNDPDLSKTSDTKIINPKN